MQIKYIEDLSIGPDINLFQCQTPRIINKTRTPMKTTLRKLTNRVVKCKNNTSHRMAN